MESATTIVSAIALGAAATLQPTITPAVKDAYDGLKSLIKRKYPNINVDRLEGSPESRARRIILEEDLEILEQTKMKN